MNCAGRQNVLLALALAALSCFAFPPWVAAADTSPVIVVFTEPGYPPAHTAAPSAEQLRALLPGARFAALQEFEALLKDPAVRMCVLPYGSAFPEDAWPEIYGFLQRGGNLLVLGGRPFTRAAYHDASGWRLR